MRESRKGWRRLLDAIPALLIVLTVIAIAAPPVLAQEQPRKSRNLFEFLFGSRGDAPQEPAAKPKNRVKSPKARPTVAAEPEIAAVEKLPTAKTVLVIGDFMGSGLAEGLGAVFAQNPEIKVVDRTNGSSGFARPDYFDWPTEVEKLIDAEKPAAVIVMLGSNDRQQMRVGEIREPLLSETWTKEYQARSMALAAAISERKVPFIWVGQPPFKSKKMLSDMLAFNDAYRQAAEAAGGSFIDIWDGFVDENGAYVSTGPDINGQPVRLRANDGINLSKAGKRKVAFYVEKPLNKILDLGAADAAVPAIAALPELGQGSRLPVDRTPPVSLDDPELDGGTELLGLNATPRSEARSPAERLVIEGLAPDAMPGRADDFLGKASPPAVAPEKHDTTTTVSR